MRPRRYSGRCRMLAAVKIVMRGADKEDKAARHETVEAL
jgi:hypothetical protein